MPLPPSKSHTVHFSWVLQSVRDSQSRKKSSFHICSCFTFLIHVFTPEHTIWLYSCICLSTSLPACSLCGGPSSTSLIALFLPHHTAEKQMNCIILTLKSAAELPLPAEQSLRLSLAPTCLLCLLQVPDTQKEPFSSISTALHNFLPKFTFIAGIMQFRGPLYCGPSPT